jgi:hypothetical protein
MMFEVTFLKTVKSTVSIEADSAESARAVFDSGDFSGECDIECTDVEVVSVKEEK